MCAIGNYEIVTGTVNVPFVPGPDPQVDVCIGAPSGKRILSMTLSRQAAVVSRPNPDGTAWLLTATSSPVTALGYYLVVAEMGC